MSKLHWSQNREGIKALVLLAVLTAFLEGITVAWLVLDRQPPWWDDSFYLSKSLLMLDALVHGGMAEYVRRFFSIMPNRPPLITVLPTPIYLLLGRNPNYAFGVNLLFIPVLLASVYLLGKQFWGRRAGLVAAYIVGTMPLIYGLARWYLVEFSLTALVALAIYLLVRSKEFRRFREVLAFGIISGMGLLLKETFALWVLLPFLYVFSRFLSSRRSLRQEASTPSASRLKTISALAVPSLLLALPWYLRNFGPTLHLVELAAFSSEADIYGTGSVFSFPTVKNYLLELAGSGTSYYYALLALAALTLMIILRNRDSLSPAMGKEPLAVLSLWSLPFLLFLFGRNKNLRYVAPILPVFALVLAFALDTILKALRKYQGLLLCVILIFPAMSALQKSFFIFGDRLPRLNRFLSIGDPADIARKYERAAWPLRRILDAVAKRTEFEPGRKKIVLVGTDQAYFNSDNFELTAAASKLPFDVWSSARSPSLIDSIRSLDSADFFIYKEGGEPEAIFFNKYQRELIQEVHHNPRFIELPLHWPLPDGGTVDIFENTTPWWSITNKAFIPSGVEAPPSCKVNFDDLLELTGLSTEQAGRVLKVRFEWKCLKPPARDYWCFAHVLNQDGKIVGFLDHPILASEPEIETWKKGDRGLEELEFPVPPTVAHQGLQLSIGLYDVVSGQRLPIRSFDIPGIAHAALGENDTALIISSLAAPDESK